MFSLRRKALTWSDVRVGLFMFVGLVAVVFCMLFFKPGKHLGSSVRVRTIFSSVGGLLEGAPVMISGVQVGTVDKIQFVNPADIAANQPLIMQLKSIRSRMDQLDVKNPAQHDQFEDEQRDYADIQSHLKHIAVLMSVSSTEVNLIRGDSMASLRTESLVGEKYVSITAATPQAPAMSPVTDKSGVVAIEVPSVEPADLNAILGNVSSATSSLQSMVGELSSDIKNGKGTIGKLIKDPSVHDELKATLKASAQATQYTGDLLKSIKEGRGTVGKIFIDPSLYNSVNEIMRNLHETKGSLGRLINDPTLYNHANHMMQNMDDITSKATQGHGAVEKLLNDPSLYNHGAQAFKEASELIAGVNHGKGTLGKFANDDQFYATTSQTMTSLAKVADKINHGEGTIGQLVQDKRLYENMTNLSGELLAFMRDFRKNPRKYLTVHLNVIKLF